MTSEKMKRKVWTREETLGFLRCYLARKDEFRHVRKKKFAYQHVLEDMVSLDIADPSTTPPALEFRMRTLLTAYKTWKETSQQSRETPSEPHPYYMQLMEEIFGDEYIVSPSQTLNFGQGPTEPFTIECDPLEASEPKKRKICKDEYYERKLELKRRHIEKTEKQREEFLKDIKTTFKDHLKKMVEIENKKVGLLHEFLNKKPTIKRDIDSEYLIENNGF